MKGDTKFSFGLLSVVSIGLILVYLTVVITVGAAGHSSGDSLSFFLIALYSIVLVVSLLRFRKQAQRTTRVVLLVMLIPVVVLFLYFIFRIGYQALTTKSGLPGVELFIVVILTLFVISAMVVISALMAWNTESGDVDSGNANKQ